MKKSVLSVTGALAILSLGACSYNAPVNISPNLNVYSSYGDKIRGSYLLYVDESDLSTTVKPTGITCAAHTYPVELRGVFKSSALRTMQQLVDDVQLVDRPIPAASLAAMGKSGMIVIRAENMSARLQFIPGFWSNTPEATTEITASLTVDTPTGRALGTTASGDARESAGSSNSCGDGAAVVGRATEKALNELFGQIGERFSNSPRIRQTSVIQ